MKFVTIAAVGAVAMPTTLATPLNVLFGRAVGSPCDGPNTWGKTGTCKHTAKCNGVSYKEPYCPNDPADVQCCVEEECSDDQGRTGVCRSISASGSLPGHFFKGNGAPWPCFGTHDIQCYIDAPADNGQPAGNQPANGPPREDPVKPIANPPEGGKGAPPPPPPPTLGERVLGIAIKQKGIDYSFGGGTCHGPSIGQNGLSGFDCSRLVAYSLAHATGGCETGQNLFAKGFPNTTGFWCKSGIKKVPYSQRRAGDAVMFGATASGCNCNTVNTQHMGIVDYDINKMWNAPQDGEVVELGNIYSENRCDQVLRFEEIVSV